MKEEVEVASQSRDKRLNFVKGFMGTNRTGKSVTARKIADWWKEANPGEDIMAFDPQNRFKGVANKFISIEDTQWPYKAMKLKNALLILDDYRLINEGDRPIKGFRALMTVREDQNIDIIYICHNPMLILEMLTYFTTHYYMFYSLSKEGQFKYRMPNYELSNEASEMINAYVRKYGRGKYPNFPFVIVDTEAQDLKLQNMSKSMPPVKKK